MKFITVIALKL